MCSDGRKDEGQRDKGVVDDAEAEEMLDSKAYPGPDYRRPHSRRCSCNRISWMALNTTGVKKRVRKGSQRERTSGLTLDLLGIGCASVVGVDLLRCSTLIQGDKSL